MKLVNNKPVAHWLKRQLREHGWRSAALAKAVGVRPTTISYLLCSRMFVGPELAVKIEKAMGAPGFAKTVLRMQAVHQADVMIHQLANWEPVAVDKKQPMLDRGDHPSDDVLDEALKQQDIGVPLSRIKRNLGIEVHATTLRKLMRDRRGEK